MGPAGTPRLGQVSSPTSAMIMAITITVVCVLPVFLTGALAVEVRSGLAFGTAQLGIAVAAFFGAAAVATIAAGGLADRFGALRVMTVAAGLEAATLACLSLSPSWTFLVVVLAAAGGVNGVAQPAINQFVARRIGPTRQGFAFGIKQAAIPLATLLGGISVPLLALTLGWRAAYALASPLAALVCLVASRFRSQPSPAVQPTSAAGPAAAQPAAAGPMSVHLPQPSRARRPDLGPLVLVAVGGGLGAGAAATLGTFLVIAAVDRGLSPSAAGLLAAGASAVGLSSRLANGALADHRTDSHFAVVTLMLLVGCGGYLMLGAGPRWSLVVGAALAYGCGWGWNGLLNFAVVRSYPTVPGRATSITQGGVYLGNVLGPLGFGVLLTHASLSTAWSADAVCSLGGATVIMVGGRMVGALSGAAGRA